MRTLVVYESMYGNTHAIADSIAAGVRSMGEVKVVPVREATDELVDWAELVIVGGPTHAHGMARPSTRQNARRRVDKADGALSLDPNAEGPSLREWLGSLGARQDRRAAAFDTRAGGPAVLTGRASSGIASELRKHGFRVVIEPESFLVDRHTELVAGEPDRAVRWGAQLVEKLATAG